MVGETLLLLAHLIKGNPAALHELQQAVVQQKTCYVATVLPPTGAPHSLVSIALTLLMHTSGTRGSSNSSSFIFTYGMCSSSAPLRSTSAPRGGNYVESRQKEAQRPRVATVPQPAKNK